MPNVKAKCSDPAQTSAPELSLLLVVLLTVSLFLGPSFPLVSASVSGSCPVSEHLHFCLSVSQSISPSVSLFSSLAVSTAAGFCPPSLVSVSP